MRILHFADLHLDAPFAWARPETARQRRRNRRETLTRILSLAQDEGVDAIFCGGDLFEHDRVSPDTIEFMRSSFGSLERPIYLAPGNHDWLAPQSPYLQVAWPSNVHLFRSSRLEPVSLQDGLTLWGAAHRVPANTDGFFAGFRPDRGGIHLALAHASERGVAWREQGGKQPHAPFDADELEAANVSHAFLGHYHVPRDAERHTYPGNPDPLEFGEEGERGAVLATIAADGSVHRERHRLAVSEVADIRVSVDGAAHADEVNEAVAAGIANLYGSVRVTLVGDVAPSLEVDLDGLRRLGPHLDELVVRVGQLTVGYDLARIATQATVQGHFVRAAFEIADPELRRRVVLTGLRALAGRRDLEVA
jgi:DNA repair exonuclease SbcCD nuclease subunit